MLFLQVCPAGQQISGERPLRALQWEVLAHSQPIIAKDFGDLTLQGLRSPFLKCSAFTLASIKL